MSARLLLVYSALLLAALAGTAMAQDNGQAGGLVLELLVLDGAGEDASPALTGDAARVIAARLDAAGYAARLESPDNGELLLTVAGAALADEQPVTDLATRQAQFGFHEVVEDADPASPPPGCLALPRRDGQDLLVVRQVPVMTGADLERAEATSNGDAFGVLLAFTPGGGARLARITRENLGKPLAMVLDHMVLAAPVIQAPVTDGRALLGGQFTAQEARLLAATLQGGVLPARVEVQDVTLP